MRILAFVLVTLTAGSAMAAREVWSDFRNDVSVNPRNILAAVALNASAAARTITLSSEGFSDLRVLVFYTYSAATTVTAQATCSYDGTNYVRITSRAITAGASVLSLFADTYTTGGASADFSLEYSVSGCRKVKVLFGGASAGAGDLVNIQAVATVGG